MEDIFIPKSSAESALVGPLQTVTIITSDKARMETIFCEGYGLSFSGWRRPADAERDDLNTYLGLSAGDGWSFSRFEKRGHGGNVEVRVIELDRETPVVRPAHEGLYKGGATLSFPINDLHAHETWMSALGVETTIGVKEMDFTSPTGETYTSAEIVYKAPDGVFVMGVKRPDIFVPVGPVDQATGLGGPAYSARCVTETAKVLNFFEQVLGFEIRRDVEFTVGERSAINMPEGTTERFIQGFAPGSSSGYVVLMDHGEATKFGPAPSFGPPNRGITMWTFETRELDEVHRRATAFGAETCWGPVTPETEFHKGGRSLKISDPDGFVIEVVESAISTGA